MIKIIKISAAGPLVIGSLDDQVSIHGTTTYIVKRAVSIVHDEGQMRFTDLLPFTNFEDGIEFPTTSVEFISTPTDDIITEYEMFCEDIIGGKTEALSEPQLLVEGNN